ncbi:hypothetical protein STENM327S_04227 [Streptomyces tendae]
MSRTRWRLGLSVTALLTASALLPSPAHAEAVAEAALRPVDPPGPAIRSDQDAVNTETDTPVTPVTSTFSGAASTFTYTFPANSVTFLRIRQR